MKIKLHFNIGMHLIGLKNHSSRYEDGRGGPEPSDLIVFL